MIIVYICVYAVFVGFFLIEHFIRKGKDTKNMNRTEFDKGSTTFISVAMGTAFVIIPLAPIPNYFKVGNVFSVGLGVVGLLLGVLGLIIRYSAFTTLGRFFTRTLREAEDHKLVTNGIYKHIRHPGYLSDMLIFIGVALAMGNLIPLVAVPIMFIPAYLYRIHTEEKMLIGIFGENYVSYRQTSKRLIPFIY